MLRNKWGFWWNIKFKLVYRNFSLNWLNSIYCNGGCRFITYGINMPWWDCRTIGINVSIRWLLIWLKCKIFIEYSIFNCYEWEFQYDEYSWCEECVTKSFTCICWALGVCSLLIFEPPPNDQLPNCGRKFGPGPYFCASLAPIRGDVCPFTFCDAVTSRMGELSCLISELVGVEELTAASLPVVVCVELDRLGNSCPNNGDLWFNKFCLACAAATCAALVPVCVTFLQVLGWFGSPVAICGCYKQKGHVTFTSTFKLDVQYIFILSEFMTYLTCCGTLVCGWLKLFVRFWVCSTTFPVSNLACPLLEGAFGFSALDLSSLPAHPEEPVGTIAIVGSFPWCSAFKLGRLAGARRAVGIFPRLWSPCFCGMVFCWGFVAEP